MNITRQEQELRLQKIRQGMTDARVDSLFLRSIPSFLYLTGTVMQGYIYVSLSSEPLFFLERPSARLPWYDASRVHYVRKPELIPDLLKEYDLVVNEGTALELGQLPVTEYQRLSNLAPNARVSDADATELMRKVRSIKTEGELAEIRKNAETHMEIYRLAPTLYEPGMTDRQWQHALEYQMRRRGSIGVFRCFGWRMEIHMGNLVTGDNAQNPAPYDFAMGGAGVSGMPFGANGTVIRDGMSVMVDMAGNFSEYTTDITRTYALGPVHPQVQKAHDLSVELHEWFADTVRPGLPIAEVYTHCVDRVMAEGLGDYFMGTEWQSKFVGHGLGLEINEVPVLTGRWKGVFESNMAIAFEPKFVIPGAGPAGIENTYIISESGVENVSPLDPGIIPLGER